MPKKRATTLETWTYRAAMIAGGILLVSWIGQLLEKKPIWEVGHAGVYVLAAVMLTGLSLTWWARIYLGPLWSSVITRKRDHKIIDTGPYAFVRHPIYCGLIIALLATAIAEGRLGALLGSVLVILGVWQKARTEERFLVTELGPEIYGALLPSRTDADPVLVTPPLGLAAAFSTPMGYKRAPHNFNPTHVRFGSWSFSNSGRHCQLSRILAGPMVLSAVGARPPHDGVR